MDSQTLNACEEPDNKFQDVAEAENSVCQVHDNHGLLARPVPFEQGINSIKTADKTQSKKNIVFPSLAKKLATSVAVLGASVALPVQGLLSQIRDSPDFVEVACSQDSSLTASMEYHGYTCKRVNYKTGYDLSSKKGTSLLKLDFQLHTPRFSWVSLPCTRLTSLQNLTERSELEWSNFEKKVGADLKRADEVAEAISCGLDARMDFDFGWEWPTSAARGWKSRAIQRLLAKLSRLKRPVYWCRFHGCAYGLEYKGIPILKGWTVLTTNRHVWLTLQKKCTGHPEHAQCRGIAAQASAYTTPPRMVRDVTKAIIGGWQEAEARQGFSLTRDIEHFLLDVPEETYGDQMAEDGVPELR